MSMKKRVSLFLALMMALSLATAAVSVAESGNAGRERVTIVYSQPNNSIANTELVASDPITRAIAEAVNIDLVVDSSTEAYADRMMTELIAGIGPDFFPNWNMERSVQWIEEGLVCDIGAIINAEPERYPILHRMINSPEYRMYNEVYTGDPDKTYAIYALGYGISWAGASLYNRQLLESAGFTEAPTTVEEFVAYANALGAEGISGWWPRNNKLTNLNEIDKTLFAPNGTTLMAPVGGDAWTGFIPVDGPEGVEGDWKLMTTSDETKEALKILADMYQNKGVDNGLTTKDDFTDAKNEFALDKIGAFNHGFSSYLQVKGFVDDMFKANPEKTYEDYVLGTVLTGGGGLGVTYSAPFWMGYHWFIPDSCDHPDRVLDFVEYLATDEGQNLLFRGIEGQHYTMDGDEIVYNAEAWLEQGKIYDITDGRYRNVMFTYIFNAGQRQLELETSSDWFTASMNPLVPDFEPEIPFKAYVTGVLDSYKENVAGFLPPYFTIISLPAEYSDMRTKMNEITLQYIPAFIAGQKDIDAEWDNYVAEYEKAGAAVLEAAFNEAKDAAKEKYEALTK